MREVGLETLSDAGSGSEPVRSSLRVPTAGPWRRLRISHWGEESERFECEQEYEEPNEHPQEPGCRTVVSVCAKTRRSLLQLQRTTTVAIASTYYHTGARSNVFSASIPGTAREPSRSMSAGVFRDFQSISWGGRAIHGAWSDAPFDFGACNDARRICAMLDG